MRIFERDGKTNFADVNDVLVGYDAWDNCCEVHGYALHSSFPPSEPRPYMWQREDEGAPATECSAPSNLEEMVFDVDFFEELPGYDEGGRVFFRLVSPRLMRPRRDETMRRLQRGAAVNNEAAEVYLELFNHHNGYYSHGFTVEVGGEVIRESRL